MTDTAPSPTGTANSARALAIAALGTLLTLMAFTAPLATINSTAADLMSDAAGRTWILSSMSIGLAAALLTTGTVADDFGRRRTFALGAVVLAVGAIICALAPNTLIFVLARILQGLGGAAVVASSLGIIAHTHAAGPVRAKASGVWGASVGAGIALGPLLAAVLDRSATWRTAYVVLAIATLALAVAAHVLVEESRSDAPRGLDPVGALLLATGIAALLAALVEGRQGWTAMAPIILFVLAALLLGAFMVLELRSAAAMLDLTLFRHPPFLAATVAALATGGGIIALMSYMPGFLGTVLGIDALGAALLLFGWSATSVVTALLARRLPASLSGRTQLAVGLVGVAIGMLMLTGLSENASWPRLLPGLLVAGVASGVLNAALGREAVASVPAGRGGMGSGANNTARYVGSAIGVTVVAVVAVPAGSGAGGMTQAISQNDAGGLVQGWNTAALVTAAISVLGAVVVSFSRTRR
ncbi:MULTISPECIES: MFS transporter [unclassified Rhodococcus (in: high G+C Gram-positive bacteria)]|uniref:MFS transporter n=1 Tax=unclassified Rhodococcus (in: high G+C Gram-positive bacteria) TaxID=192944 RepID=UPI000B9A5C9B|nr:MULTISPECIES: MFS transporter [unclassified Rhodococcus (in: high G+C Gram-positive bacteria)]OZE38367.1 MFS transporter [Rhodococcus sp. 05-2254-4]OZE47171.1 MFS transporter [Rhodococcus sp. 05-2254-3]OZE54837.1 MFS transporter [Rhodococcus sp. 05-2254-2]